MSEPKHTPGPWNIRNVGYRNLKVKPVFVSQIVDMDGNLIAENYGETSESEANAHVLSASTDLLKSSKDVDDCLTALEALGKIQWSKTLACLDLRAAIAKAEGR